MFFLKVLHARKNSQTKFINSQGPYQNEIGENVNKVALFFKHNSTELTFLESTLPIFIWRGEVSWPWGCQIFIFVKNIDSWYLYLVIMKIIFVMCRISRPYCCETTVRWINNQPISILHQQLQLIIILVIKSSSSFLISKFDGYLGFNVADVSF